MKCKFIYVCMELWFVWECLNTITYVERGVSFLNEYVNFFPHNYMQSEVEDIFDGWLFVLQEFSGVFFHSTLVLLHFPLDMTVKVFRSKNGKTIRLNIEQVSFSKEFFKHVVKKFTTSPFQNSIWWRVLWLHEVFYMVGTGSPKSQSAGKGPV